jgi:UDP-3-O-[3-hydroxymyristoyl] glucosamine N-acyltransferase
MKIKDVAVLIEGTIEGDENVDITGLSGAESAKAGDLTFALDESKLILAEQSDTACILTTPAVRKSTKPLIRVSNPKLSFLLVYNAFHPETSAETSVHPSAVIADSVTLGKHVLIGAHVSIEEDVTIGDHTIIENGCVIKKNCTIGNACHLFPHVTLYENTVLSHHVRLHGGTVVGADGFGYVKDKSVIHKFPQLGKVIIEENVEIGANTTIDRGALSDTVIGAGSKIDNLCQIAHNVKLGKNVIIAAQSGIAGSTIVGDNVTISGQVAITNNVTIGKNAVIGGKSCVISDVAENTTVWGMPARPIHETKRQLAVLSWLTKHFAYLSKMVKDTEA